MRSSDRAGTRCGEAAAAASRGARAAAPAAANSVANRRRLRVDMTPSWFCRRSTARKTAGYFLMNDSISATVLGRPGVRFSQPVSVMTMVSSTRTPSLSSANTA